MRIGLALLVALCLSVAGCSDEKPAEGGTGLPADADTGFILPDVSYDLPPPVSDAGGSDTTADQEPPVTDPGQTADDPAVDGPICGCLPGARQEPPPPPGGQLRGLPQGRP